MKTIRDWLVSSYPIVSFALLLKLFFAMIALLLLTAPSARAQSTGTFSVTGSMATARASATATVLPNGKVLITGGNTAAAELYDPASGTFSATGSMNDTRASDTATVLNTGKVLIQGGEFGQGIAELYDPASGVFTVTGTPTNFLGYYEGSTATLLNNGKVLIVGGDSQQGPTPHTELYDPTTGTFSKTGPLTNVDAMHPYAPYNHTATLLGNGKVLIAGGDTFFNGSGGTYSIAELYDPSSGTFSAPITMVAARAGHTATLLSNGKVLLAGGYFHNCCGLPMTTSYGDQAVHGINELFDPSTNTFTRTGDLNGARFSQTATTLPNGQVLIAGGSDDTITNGVNSGGPVAPAELYDPTAGTFSVTGSMNTPRYDHGAALMSNGLVLLAGGDSAPRGSTDEPLASAELYHPATSSTAAVTITTPANGATVSGTVAIAVTVSSSVQWVNFYVDGNYLGSSPPNSFNWNSTSVADGSHIISVNAYNGSGQIGSAASTVTVANSGTAGAVKITAPATGATVSGTVAITTTVNSSVQWVNIYIDGNYLTSSPPYNFNWDSTSVADGTHVISAKAFNGSGLVGNDSVTVTVGNGATSGSVKITAPARGATVSGTVTITATVTAQVSWINIYIDGNYFASSPPYSFSWNTTTVPNGTHSIAANA